MVYKVIVSKAVHKQISKLPENVRVRIIENLEKLATDPRPFGYIKLKGYDDQYRIRVGVYRVRYQIRDKEVIVLIIDVTHRKDAYGD